MVGLCSKRLRYLLVVIPKFVLCYLKQALQAADHVRDRFELEFDLGMHLSFPGGAPFPLGARIRSEAWSVLAPPDIASYLNACPAFLGNKRGATGEVVDHPVL